MDISSAHEGDIPMPINSRYGGGHGHNMIHEVVPSDPHNHIITTSASPLTSNGPILIPAPNILEEEHNIVPYKKVVRYRECLKNHAASMGGNSTDGCGEFMPSGEEGTLEALKCSACSCHRNFHRKEIEGDQSSSYHHDHQFYHLMKGSSRKVVGQKGVLIAAGSDQAFGYHPTGSCSLIPRPHPQMIMSYNLGLPSSDQMSSDHEHEELGGGAFQAGRPHLVMKKRFRTKFTQEQKEKMLDFAEKVGWKIQKQEEGVVQHFCQEIGVKRRVLKVWMHNNKHNLAKKASSTPPLPLDQHPMG